MSAMLAGPASVALFWTEFAGWSMPLAMFALVVGNLALLLDWFRDVPRFSISVIGMTTGTVALCLAFVNQGGLDLKTHEPTVATREAAREVVPAVPEPAPSPSNVEPESEKATVPTNSAVQARQELMQTAAKFDGPFAAAVKDIVDAVESGQQPWSVADIRMNDRRPGQYRFADETIAAYERWRAAKVAAPGR